MAKFFNTSAANYYLEELIKLARERLTIISPFLKFSEQIKELLTDKDRMKIDVRLVYGKSELGPQEMNWLRSLEFVRTSFCQNLHAKCYLNERSAIITSMNLYDFSQINNNEMGVFIEREHEPELYRDTYEEAQRLIRVSEQVRLSAEKVEDSEPQEGDDGGNGHEKLTTSKLARCLGVRTADLTERLVGKGLLQVDADRPKLTESGKQAGGEFRFPRVLDFLVLLSTSQDFRPPFCAQ